jgi:membrane protein implicated in regulation of membrane protease activity
MDDKQRRRPRGAIWSLWIIGLAIIAIGIVMLALGAGWWMSTVMVLLGLASVGFALYLHAKSHPGGRPHPPR